MACLTSCKHLGTRKALARCTGQAELARQIIANVTHAIVLVPYADNTAVLFLCTRCGGWTVDQMKKLGKTCSGNLPGLAKKDRDLITAGKHPKNPDIKLDPGIRLSDALARQ